MATYIKDQFYKFQIKLKLQTNLLTRSPFDQQMSTLSIHQKIQSCLDYCQISYDNELLQKIVNMMELFFQ